MAHHVLEVWQFGHVGSLAGLLSKAGGVLGSTLVSIRGIYAIEDLVILGKQGWIPIIRLPFIFHPDKGSAWLGVVFWEAMVLTEDDVVNSLVSLSFSFGYVMGLFSWCSSALLDTKGLS